MSSKLYQVFFQEDSKTEPKIDVAFSEEDAKKAVLGFYQDKVSTIIDTPFSFQDITSIDAWHKAHPNVEAKAWYDGLVVEDEAFETEAIQPDPVSLSRSGLLEGSMVSQLIQSDLLADQLFALLHQAGLDIERGQLRRLVDKAYHHALDALESASDSESSIEANPQPEEDEVWLIYVGGQDVGLYLGETYIDSASKSEQHVFDEVVSTAEMLAQRQKTSVKRHFFEDMPNDWSWSKIETILTQAGILSQQPKLLMRLKDAPYVKVNDLIPAKVHWFETTYKAYIQKGQEDLELIRFEFNKGELLETVSLTVDQIATAVEVTKDYWVCGDLYGTEILFSNHLIPTQLSSLLR